MPRDVRAYLWHIEEAADAIAFYVQGKTFADYVGNSMMQAAIERKFEIVGEALVRIAAHFPETAGLISDHRSFINFRNVLIHQYDDLNAANI